MRQIIFCEWNKNKKIPQVPSSGQKTIFFLGEKKTPAQRPALHRTAGCKTFFVSRLRTFHPAGCFTSLQFKILALSSVQKSLLFDTSDNSFSTRVLSKCCRKSLHLLVKIFQKVTKKVKSLVKYFASCNKIAWQVCKYRPIIIDYWLFIKLLTIWFLVYRKCPDLLYTYDR